MSDETGTLEFNDKKGRYILTCGKDIIEFYARNWTDAQLRASDMMGYLEHEDEFLGYETFYPLLADVYRLLMDDVPPSDEYLLNPYMAISEAKTLRNYIASIRTVLNDLERKLDEGGDFK